MKKKISLIAREQKRLYTGFLIAAVALFALTTLYTNFNPMVLVRNGDAFWSFITEDFLPPRSSQGEQHPRGVLKRSGDAGPCHVFNDHCGDSGLLRLPFRKRKGFPLSRGAKYVRGFATFLRNIPALCGRLSCFPRWESERAWDSWRCVSPALPL